MKESNNVQIVTIETRVTETITVVRRILVDPVKIPLNLPRTSPLKQIAIKGTVLDELI